MERTWDFPARGFVKVNVHAFTLNEPLPNGNDSGIGVVVRDRTGVIIKMISGTIRNLTPRANELWAMLAGLRTAYYEGECKIQLESDNEDAVKEWDDWRWFLDPNHSRVIQQLEQRKKDPNLVLEVKVVNESQNRLARFLAVNGAENRSRLVVFRRSFGQVRNLWRLDMGLGAMADEFEEISEDEYDVQMAEQLEHEASMELIDLDAEESGVLANDAQEAGMGARVARANV